MKRFLPSLSPTAMRLLAIAAIVIAPLAEGCGNDPVGSTDPKPAGLSLKENGAEKVKQSGGTVTGKIEIARPLGSSVNLTPSGQLELSFTKEDGTEWAVESGDSIGITDYNSDVVRVERNPGSKTSFKLLGRGGGQTGMEIAYFRGSKLIFTSRNLPIIVTSQGLDLAKMRVVTAGGGLVTVTDTVAGKITGAWGTEPSQINIDFFDPLGEVMDLWNDPEVEINWDVADTSIVEFMQDPDDHANIKMLAKKPGQTTVVFTLKHNSTALGSYTAFKSPVIDVDIH